MASEDPAFGEIGSLIGYVRMARPLQLVGEGAPGIYEHISSSAETRADTLPVASIRLVPSGILVTRKTAPVALFVPWHMVNHTRPPAPVVTVTQAPAVSTQTAAPARGK